MIMRFLEKTEYRDTIPLFISCFGNDEEFIKEYYGDNGIVFKGRIGVIELDGRIISMIHYHLRKVCLSSAIYEVPYIMCVSTIKEYRHQGFMHQLMNFVLVELRGNYSFCFLMSTNPSIYNGLGFDYLREVSEEECDKLYGDDGLRTVMICPLNLKEYKPDDPFEVL